MLRTKKTSDVVLAMQKELENIKQLEKSKKMVQNYEPVFPVGRKIKARVLGGLNELITSAQVTLAKLESEIQSRR